MPRGVKVKGPFTETDVQQWNDALSKCEQIRAECELGKQAGFACDEMLKTCEAMRDQLMAMKRTYAPHLP